MILSGIIDAYGTTLKSPKFQEYSRLIYIDTWENSRYEMHQHKAIVEEGFSFCNVIKYEYIGLRWEIIINMENCNKVGCTGREIAAIIYHECLQTGNIILL